ncbi:transposase [Neobacillus piezotolerans]|uniref:Transposase n=1 Tax=Neobacillus piezotolerans TaxID=2259171 RepID=A0A3D8GRD4_9BACI|nr:transposase [Neobacillus piezotolerans]RDU36887.1 transposase [Neobacillus piezotolerans]
MVIHRSPSFVLTLELDSHPKLFSAADKELEILRVLYNTVLGNYLKLENQMKRLKEYKRCIRQLHGVKRKLALDEENPFLLNELECIREKLQDLREQYQLTEYASHAWAKGIRKHFGDRVNAAVAQKTASRAWLAFRNKLFGKAKKVVFLRKGEMVSFEGKTNTTGWRYSNNHLVYKDMSTPLKWSGLDSHVSEILSHLEKKTPFTYSIKKKGETLTITDFYHVKYVRIVRKTIRGKVRFFADLIIAGYPSPKGRKLGKGKVGLDIGTASLAVSSPDKAALFNLAEGVKDLAREIKLAQRKMDRSRRTTNPGNYHENGTVKKGRKVWQLSNRYRKQQARVRELNRKQAAIRKLSHQRLANSMLALGDAFFIETMNLKVLQKKAKETKVSEKTGKYAKKKRFGKTIGHRAPSMFVGILEQKVKSLGGSFKRVNTKTFKASQYCHVRNGFFKKPLSERWHVIDEETRIQRDLYSAFLLMNANSSGTKPKRIACMETFPGFKSLHDDEIHKIKIEKRKILNSGILL